MLNLTLAGTVGRDAEYKEGMQGGGGRCSFPVAVNIGYGDNKSTVWIDVTSWGKGAKGLSGFLTKGSKVAVTGKMSTREHNGKTYIQCRADDVTIMGSSGERKRAVDPNNQEMRKQFAQHNDDMDDDIPF